MQAHTELETADASPVMGAELQEARRLAWIVQSSVDAVVGASLNGSITDWNPAAERLYGYTAGEALGQPIWMLAPPALEGEARDFLRRVLRGEFVENADTVRRRKDGAPIDVMLSISPIRNDVGDIVGISKISRDVTARRHDERTIAALHAVAYSASHIMDAERLVALTTAKVRDAFGVDAFVIYWWDPATEMLRPIGNAGEIGSIPLSDSEQRSGEGLAGIVFEGRSPLIVEDYASWAEADPRLRARVVSAMAVPMYVGEQVVGVLAALALARRSFTEHDLQLLTRFAGEVAPAIAVGQLLADAQAERSRAEAFAARVSMYFRASPVPGVISRSADLTFVDVNDAFVALLGYSREELIGRTALDFGIVAPQEEAAIISVVDRVGEARQELTLRTRTGELRSVLTFVEKTEIAGEACLIVGYVDLSDQKRALALDLRRQVLEEASRAKSAFLANMSHELRTPLNAILGFSKLLLEESDLGERERRYLSHIRDAGGHLLEVINDVLDVSRVEAGKMELRRESIALPALLEPVVATARLAAEGRGVLFEATATQVPMVMVDPTRFRQILNNLLSNAVKFTPAGGSVLLSVTAEDDALLVEVRDSGIGFPPESQGRVFRTFERFHEGVNGAPGTGLGLALTKALVELHGGAIMFESAVGVGTTFSVRLPGSVPYGGPGRRLLIVEDDSRDADLVVALAERSGLAVELATSVAGALSAIERGMPAGILIDLRLPDGRGETILGELRKRGAHVPTVVVTVEDEQTPEAAANLGVDDYLTKPLDAARLDRWLARLGTREEGRLGAHTPR